MPRQEAVEGHRAEIAVGFKAGEAETRGEALDTDRPTPQLCAED